jgi:PIN domain nuclease of toxin-antitoxin system
LTVFVLDTHMALVLIGETRLELPSEHSKLLSELKEKYVSAASLWEVALKVRTGKLVLTFPLSNLPRVLEEYGCVFLAISPDDAIEELVEIPSTRDPFDRLLLAQCQRRKLQLLTIDHALVPHPLAWKPQQD